jgi:excinuclease UvrABC ATPase subunit
MLTCLRFILSQCIQPYHDGGRSLVEGTPADLVAARSTLTAQHLANYVSSV